MYVTAPYNFVHYGTVSFSLRGIRFTGLKFLTHQQEYYSSGTAATCVECSGERDTSCSAGNGMYGVTAGHFYSFGVGMGAAGCSSSLL
jgi:hypothetical protein